MAETAKPARGRPIPPLIKLGLDLGPLVIFFVSTLIFGIYVATAVFMVALSAVLAIGFVVERKLGRVPLITGILVLVFGGLTLWLADDTFIKIKPTVLYVLFAIVLVIGVRFNRLYVKMLLSQAFQLHDHAWRVLTWRFAAYFLSLALLNEIVWRSFPTPIWAGFKLAIFPLTLLFAAAQVPFMLRNQIDDPPPSP